MKEYSNTKRLGMIVGILTIIGAIGYGVLMFIGMGLSRAWDTTNDYSVDRSPILLLIGFLLLGCTTTFGPFMLNSRGWRIFYLGFAFIIGMGLIIIYFISLGAFGYGAELFILVLGIVYLGLGFIAKKKL